jgi:cell division cycle protein 20 (cofactor of APC complex)
VKACETKKATRYLPQAPEKILDAPDIVDDYYLNLMDWGMNNTLSVCLGQSVYLWNSVSGDTHHLLNTNDSQNYVSSVSWMNKGNCLAVGYANSCIQLWDTEKMKPVRTLNGHRDRVSSMSWNNYILSSGSRDSLILNHDVRVANNVISKLETHMQEVCGLKWCPEGSQIASGGNDNLLCIWELGANTPKFFMRDHRAAVKALAWCPWQKGLLASGGGSADKSIRFWNTETGAMVNCVDTDSQVCSLMWNRHDREILSAHGFSKNQLSIWKYPTMTKVGELSGHTNRVLHLAMSPDGSTVVSAAADETLRFWRVFDVPGNQVKKATHKNLLSDMNLR